MSTKQNLLMRMFGCPHGLPGRVGGMIMGFSNSGYGAEDAELLHVTPNDRVLEVGFGPGNVIRHLATLAGFVAGVDKSREMVDQATARNTAAIRSNPVRLLLGSVEADQAGSRSTGLDTRNRRRRMNATASETVTTNTQCAGRKPRSIVSFA
jgi:SAM-dependent methyltransferase